MTNPDVGPRCPECRLGLGSHDTRDPLCDHSALVTVEDVARVIRDELAKDREGFGSCDFGATLAEALLSRWSITERKAE